MRLRSARYITPSCVEFNRRYEGFDQRYSIDSTGETRSRRIFLDNAYASHTDDVVLCDSLTPTVSH